MSEQISYLGVRQYVTAVMGLMKTGGSARAQDGCGARGVQGAGATGDEDCFITIYITPGTFAL